MYEEPERICRELIEKEGRTRATLQDLVRSLYFAGGILQADGDLVSALLKDEDGVMLAREAMEICGRTPDTMRDLKVTLEGLADVLLARREWRRWARTYREFRELDRELGYNLPLPPQPLRGLLALFINSTSAVSSRIRQLDRRSLSRLSPP